MDVKHCRMALCASEVMEGVVAALNRLPLNLVPSEWVEQVALKLSAKATAAFVDQPNTRFSMVSSPRL